MDCFLPRNKRPGVAMFGVLERVEKKGTIEKYWNEVCEKYLRNKNNDEERC